MSGKKVTFYHQMTAPLRRILALNLYIGMNVWQMGESESLLYNKVFVLKPFVFFATIAIFCTQMKNICLGSTSSKYLQEHIHNKGATMKSSRKTVYNICWLFLKKKGHSLKWP